MYGVAPPKSSDSGDGATNQAAFIRTYQVWKGSNVSDWPFSCTILYVGISDFLLELQDSIFSNVWLICNYSFDIVLTVWDRWIATSDFSPSFSLKLMDCLNFYLLNLVLNTW